MQMKKELRQIYDALSNGKLSQKEALEKIKAVKLREQSKGTGVLFAAPVWQSEGVDHSSDVGPVEYSEHHVILCELSKVNAEELAVLLPQSQCLALQAREQKDVAQRYSEYALSCFERINAIFQKRLAGKTLLQIVIADDQEHVLLAGLSGLLKTAARENPLIIGQLICVPMEIAEEELVSHLREEMRLGAKQETFIRYKHGFRQILRWQEVVSEQIRQPSIAFKDHGVYLITGGMGGLGILFAKEILARTSQA